LTLLKQPAFNMPSKAVHGLISEKRVRFSIAY
jgi:hypothetical protein